MQDVVNMLNVLECNVEEEEKVTKELLIQRFSNLKKENKKLKERTVEIQMRMEQLREQEREELNKMTTIEYNKQKEIIALQNQIEMLHE